MTTSSINIFGYFKTLFFKVCDFYMWHKYWEMGEVLAMAFISFLHETTAPYKGKIN